MKTHKYNTDIYILFIYNIFEILVEYSWFICTETSATNTEKVFMN